MANPKLPKPKMVAKTVRGALGPASAVSGRKSKVRAKTGTTTYKAKPKPALPRPPAKDPLTQAGEWLDKNIPTRKFKWPNLPKGIFPLDKWHEKQGK